MADIQAPSGNIPVYLTNYKSYVAMLTQENAGENPVATVVNGTDSNFLGNIAWTHQNPGGFIGVLNGSFVEGKTYLPHPGSLPADGHINMYWQDANTITIETKRISTDTFEDGWLYNTAIEIRVYP